MESSYIRVQSVEMSFTLTTNADLAELTTDRNRYLHRANVFPSDVFMRLFLTELREPSRKL